MGDGQSAMRAPLVALVRPGCGADVRWWCLIGTIDVASDDIDQRCLLHRWFFVVGRASF